MNPEQTNTKLAFDLAAKTYDSSDNQNVILQWMRGIIHKVYLDYFKSGDSLLELNAGTGEDAIYLANNGIKVLATDISPGMIDIIHTKVKMKEAENLIQTGAISFDELNTINQNNFDGVISNFGGLNCINNFAQLNKDISAKLKPGGLFIAVVMNRICPWEIFYYTLKLDFKNAFRRFNREGIDVFVNGINVRTYYFAPKEFGNKFNEFTIEKIITLGLYTPPPFLIGIYNKLKLLVKLWMKIDELVKSIFPFNRFGDHFIIVMRKK